jgi:hypothetical protein
MSSQVINYGIAIVLILAVFFSEKGKPGFRDKKVIGIPFPTLIYISLAIFIILALVAAFNA